MRPHRRGPRSSACFSCSHFASYFPTGSSPFHPCRPQSTPSAVPGTTACLHRGRREPSPGPRRRSRARRRQAGDAPGTAGAGEGHGRRGGARPRSAACQRMAPSRCRTPAPASREPGPGRAGSKPVPAPSSLALNHHNGKRDCWQRHAALLGAGSFQGFQKTGSDVSSDL